MNCFSIALIFTSIIFVGGLSFAQKSEEMTITVYSSQKIPVDQEELLKTINRLHVSRFSNNPKQIIIQNQNKTASFSKLVGPDENTPSNISTFIQKSCLRLNLPYLSVHTIKKNDTLFFENDNYLQGSKIISLNDETYNIVVDYMESEDSEGLVVYNQDGTVKMTPRLGVKYYDLWLTAEEWVLKENGTMKTQTLGLGMLDGKHDETSLFIELPNDSNDNNYTYKNIVSTNEFKSYNQNFIHQESFITWTKSLIDLAKNGKIKVYYQDTDLVESTNIDSLSMLDPLKKESLEDSTFYFDMYQHEKKDKNNYIVYDKNGNVVIEEVGYPLVFDNLESITFLSDYSLNTSKGTLNRKIKAMQFNFKSSLSFDPTQKAGLARCIFVLN